MSEPQDDAFKRAMAAATRALAGSGRIDVRFGGETAMLRSDAICLPAAPRNPTGKAAAQARGRADALALRLAHHDASAHGAKRPTTAQARDVYDAAEQARVESLGAKSLTGVADNLDAALQDRCERRGYQRMEDRQDAPIEDALAFLLRERMTGRPLPRAAQGVADLWRDVIEGKAGANLDRVADLTDDQAAFADVVRAVLADLDLVDEPGDATADDERNDEDTPPDDDAAPEPEPEDDAESDDQAAAPEAQDTQAAEAAMTEMAMEEFTGDADDFADSDTTAEGMEAAGPLPQPLTNAPELATNYRIFTSDFDEVVGADDLCEADELERLRAQLDQQVRPLEGVVARLANKLQRQLLAKQARGWVFDLEEGVLDSARLSRVIIDPMAPLSFKQETEAPFRDTVVTLLLDNSGSMRGRPILVAAVCADILARTLERCGVKVEILGFTTRAWKGGRAREAWLKSGRPTEPGRLNDLRHIIYKPADAPYRRARRALGLMMREGLLKENIDGEALVWAWRRLLARPEERRILMVISDGAPVDDSTLSVNPGGYLDRHLREVIAQIENRSEVELLAIGIGHDVTRWYSRACMIGDIDQLAGALISELADLFNQDTPGPSPRRSPPQRANTDQPGFVVASGRDGRPSTLSAAMKRSTKWS